MINVALSLFSSLVSLFYFLGLSSFVFSLVCDL